MSLTSAARPATRAVQTSELRQALSACWHAFIAVGLMSGLINILYLTGSFYMLEVYDRVLPSRSVPTLVALSVLALTLFAFQGVLDVIRSRILVRVAATLDERLSSRVYDIVVQLPLRTRAQGDGLAPLRDLDQIRSFLVTTGPLALFDLPWMPIYVLICFLFHPWIGVAALIGALILTSLTLISEFTTRRPARMAAMHVGARNGLAEAGRRNAEVLRAMGMAPRMGKIWGEANSKYLASHQQTSDVGRRPRRGIEGAPFRPAVGRARPRRLSGDPAAGDRRHHYRELDHRGARARAGGACNRELARLRRGTPELEAPVRRPCRHGHQRGADAAAAAEGEPRGRDGLGRAARRADASSSRT